MFRAVGLAALSFSALASSTPLSPPDDVQATTTHYPKVKYFGCDATQKAKLDQAFYDAHLLASAALNLDPNSTPAIDYFGKPAENLQLIRSYQANAAAWSPESALVTVHCDDPRKNEPGTLSCSSGTVAGYGDNFRKADHSLSETRLTMCAATIKDMRQLTETIHDLDGHEPNRKQTGQLYSLGQYVLHEMMHLDTVGNQKHIRDTQRGDTETGPYAYGSRQTRCMVLREEYGYEKAIYNADTYALYASVKYFENKYKVYANQPAVSKDICKAWKMLENDEVAEL
jgi:hypothetical protein